MSECKTCGRPGDGHWIGCEVVKLKATLAKAQQTPAPVSATEAPPSAAVVCAFEGCPEPRWSDAPRAQFCATHKDPKNRK